MAEELSGRIKVDVSESRQNIAALNTSIRELESGFKASAAEVDNWQTDIDKTKERVAELTEVTELQSQKIEIMEEQYRNVATALGENSSEAMKLKISINKEREAMNRNNNELRKTSERLDDMEDNADDAGDELENLGDSAEDAEDGLNGLGDGADSAGGKFSNFLANMSHLTTIVSGVKDVISDITGTIKDVAEAAWNAATGFAEMADNLLTLSANTGIDPQTLQAMQSLQGLYDVDIGTWETLLRTLMSDSVLQNIAGAGIDTTGADGALLDRLTILKNVLAEANALYQQNATEAETWLTGLGFRSGTVDDLGTLFQTDEAGLSNLAKFWASVRQLQEGGFTTSDADLQIGVDLQNELDQLNLIKEALSNLVGAGLAQLITPFVTSLNEELTELVDLWGEIRADGEITTEEYAELANQISTTISNLWSALTAEGGPLDQLWQSISPALTTLWSEISPRVESVMTKAGEWIWDGFSSALSQGWQTVVDSISDAVRWIWNNTVAVLLGDDYYLNEDYSRGKKEDRSAYGEPTTVSPDSPQGRAVDRQIMESADVVPDFANEWAGVDFSTPLYAQEFAQATETTISFADRIRQSMDDLSGAVAQAAGDAMAAISQTAAPSSSAGPSAPYHALPPGSSLQPLTLGEALPVISADDVMPDSAELSSSLKSALASSTPQMVAAAGRAADEMIAEMQSRFGSAHFSVGGIDAGGVTNYNFGGVTVAGGNSSNAGRLSAQLQSYARKYSAGRGAS